MSIENDLTYLQKVALKGEIAFALSTAAHNTEIKLRTYLFLKEVGAELRPFVLECIKEAVTFDESEIDRIYLEVINKQVPLWLWAEEVVADIKFQLMPVSGEIASMISSKLGINKKKERQNLIESAFLNFARDIVLIHPQAVELLIEKVLEDNDLKFLSNACFYLKSCCEEVKDIVKIKKSEEIMKKTFDIRECLSFMIETKALNYLDQEEEEISHHQMSAEEFAKFIDSQILSVFKSTNTPAPKAQPSRVYVVKKVFTDSGLSTDIKICKTEEEAVDFIKKIIKEYPELARTCEFQVHTERRNENSK